MGIDRAAIYERPDNNKNRYQLISLKLGQFTYIRMSSHHFVKEGQEPALIIFDAIDYERVAPLLEWAPFVLSHENTLEEVLSWGIKIDGVICRSSQVDNLLVRLSDQMPLTIIETDADDDALTSVLRFLENQKQEGACMVVKNEKEVMNSEALVRAKLNISLLTPKVKWSFIRSGRFEKWTSKGQKFLVGSGTRLREKHGVIEQGDQLIAGGDGIIKLTSDQPFWLREEY